MKQHLLQQAKTVLEQRRQKAEAEFEKRKKQIYASLPMLPQLDALQAAAGSAAAGYAMAGSKQEAAAKLQQLKEISSRKRLLLAQNALSETLLQPNYFCKLCGDKGYVKGDMCICLKQELNRLRRENVHKTSPLKLTSFDNFYLDKYPESIEGLEISPRAVMANILRDCRGFAGDFGSCSPSLFLFGDAGLGKTHLALAVASQVLDKGHSVIYVSAQAAFAKISQAKYADDQGLFAAMMGADLLVLDDLGTEYIDAYVLSKIYQLVNSRLGRPTIYTSNICSQERLHQRYTEKIASRLLGECHLMRLWGTDIRLQNKI